MPTEVPGTGANQGTGPLAELGAALRHIRVCRGLTQAQVAEAMDPPTKPSSISEYENGAGMNTDTLDRLLVAMSADVGDLARALGQAPSEERVMRFLVDLEQRARRESGSSDATSGEE